MLITVLITLTAALHSVDAVNCNFEYDTCAWTSAVSEGDLTWMRSVGSYQQELRQPLVDHTTNAPTGSYMYFNSTGGQTSQTARLESETVTGMKVSCLQVYYYMDGSGIGSLNAFIQTSVSRLVWNISGSQGDDWKMAKISINESEPYQIVLEGVVGLNDDAAIAIDDVLLTTDGACVDSTPAPRFHCGFGLPPVDQSQRCNWEYNCANGADEQDCGQCDFESDLCRYAERNGGLYTWSRNQGDTGKVGTGPREDQTTGSEYGWYIFSNSTAGTANDTAVIESPTLRACSSSCELIFWYHMYGSDIRTIEVSLKQAGISSRLWRMTGNQGDQWRRALVGIGRINTDFKIIFQSSHPNGPKGDVAIDSISFRGCGFPAREPMCTADQFRCDRGSCIDQALKCDFTDDCGDYSDELADDCVNVTRCDFEFGFCDWVQLPDDDFDWSRQRADDGVREGSGPSRDHTKGNDAGYYVYANTLSPRRPGEVARLGSRNFRQADELDGCQMTVYYHMLGSTVGSLSVYTRISQGGPLSLQFTKDGQSGDIFERRQIPLTSDEPFQVIIEATVGPGRFGDIAVDDLAFSAGCIPYNDGLPTATAAPSTASPCQLDQFVCEDRTCIPLAQKCDFAIQCTDDSDEARCGSCDFESHVCGYQDNSDGIYRWERFQAGTARSPNAPQTDSSGDLNGYYMLVEGQNSLFYSKATLVSEVFGETGLACEIRFSYYMYGADAGTLQVYLQNATTQQDIALLFSKSNQQGTQWRRVAVALGTNDPGYAIAFNAYPDDGTSTGQALDIAIDDVTFVNCHPGEVPANASQLNCTFENPNPNGMCGWMQAPYSEDNFDWARSSGAGYNPTGPGFDHTNGSGHYAYIDASHGSLGDTARLETYYQLPTGDQFLCFSFWYHMFGMDINQLSVYIQQFAMQEERIWTRYHSQGNVWLQGHVEFKKNAQWRLIFEGVIGHGFHGDIAVDDISIIDGHCPPPSDVCEFEVDFCDWTQDEDGDDFQWSRGRNGTSTPATGPQYDHTTGTETGYFAFIDASQNTQGSVARLVSPVFTAGGAKCMSFWYHLYGADIGTLLIFTVDPTGQQTGQSNWTQAIDQGNEWRYSTYTATSNMDFKIVIAAVVGSGILGDIAIDDVGIGDGECPPPGFCDFEDALLCGWINDDNDRFDWLLNTGATRNMYTGPAFDHTTGNDQGFYVLFNSFLSPNDPPAIGENALLTSQHLPPTSGSCILFWYHMLHQDYSGELNVYLKNVSDGSKQRIWHTNGNHGDVWVQGFADFKATFEYQIQFEATYGSAQADTALDDIEINSGPCPEFGCDFEDGLCNWKQDNKTDNTDWTRHKGSTGGFHTGPKFDHTTGTVNGYYMYVESSHLVITDTARLISPILSPTPRDGYCFQFWYHMLGSRVGDLNIYLRNTDGEEKLIWRRSGTQANEWRRGQRDIHMTSSYEIVVEVANVPHRRSDIAVDDLSISVGECPAYSECDFEHDFCRWNNAGYNDISLNWLRGYGGTDTHGTGPTIDHTTGTDTGFFAYINTSSAFENQVAVLTTTQFGSDGERCLKFWYHMFGEDIGALFVYQRDLGDVMPLPIWSKYGNQDDMWRRGVAPLPPTMTGNDFEISFQARVGNGDMGDIAIDDVFIDSIPCRPIGWCDFELDTCGWTNELVRDDDYDWLRNAGSTSTGQTGPSKDHTTGTGKGYYMYIETSYGFGNVGDRAWLVSEHLTPTTGQCFKFWYHMYGETTDRLTAYFESRSVAKRMMWREQGDHGNRWLQGQFTVNSSVEYWIIFEAEKGGKTSDIAIDDTSLEDGPCPVAPPPPTSPQPEVTHPPDYHNCDFEQGMCTWTSHEISDFNWTRASGATDQTGLGPPIDHTLHSSHGYYIFIESSTPRIGERAVLLSGLFNYHNPDGICMSFWYHMYGSKIGTLSIGIEVDQINGTEPLVVWEKRGDHGPKWNYDQIHIRETRNLKIALAVTIGDSWDGHIALDDITFQTGVCNFPPSCGFENDICGLMQDPNNDFDWLIRQVADIGDLRRDVTYGTDYGHVLYANRSTGQVPGAIARAISPVTEHLPVSFCLRFWTHMSGNAFRRLSVKIRELDATEYTIFTATQVSFVWQVEEVTVNDPGKFQVILEAETDSGTSGHLAVDDFTRKSGECVPFGNCNFEDGDTCTWMNLEDDTIEEFDWIEMRGAYKDSDTAPNEDHTRGTPYGTYLYLKTSSPRVEGDVAILVSGLFDNSTDRCLSFWYHMTGRDTSAIAIEMFGVGIVFSKTGYQGNGWLQASVDLPTGNLTSPTFRLAFVGRVGNGTNGDIAIDDISIEEGLCPPPPPPCEFLCNDEGGACLPMTKVCNFDKDCPNNADEDDCGYVCTFEHGECGWNDTSNGLYQWIRNQGATPASNTGPSYDHTTLTENGWYIYVDTNNGWTTDWAEYTGPTLQQSGSDCEVQFWYHMYGDDIGALRVQVAEDEYVMEVWMESGDHGDRWNHGTAVIGRIPNPFKVIFKAERRFSTHGDVAIDDITFDGCSLPEIVPSCQPSEFRCTRGSCVAEDRLCDFTDDCGDDSDEGAVLCGGYRRCHFETDYCGWNNMNGDEADWLRSTAVQLQGPMRDHTLRTSFGYVLHPDLRDGKKLDRARLGSIVFQKPNPTDTCTLRLWYYMKGIDNHKLSVYTRTSTGGPMTLEWSYIGHIGEFYQRVAISLTPDDNFQVIIEAVRGTRESSQIAIDDVSFTPDCTPYIGQLPDGTTPAPTTPYNPCRPGYWLCANGDCINSSYYCDWNVDCADGSDEEYCGSCDFEASHQCGYEDYSSGPYQWLKRQGSDHTTGVGYFMSVENAYGQFRPSAYLYSPFLPESSENCTLNFWTYQLQNDSSISVNIISLSQSASSSQLWRSRSAEIGIWQEVTVDIGRSQSFLIQIVADMFVQHRGLYIDDISFVSCSTTQMQPTCHTDEYKCDDGTCIKSNLRCDFTADCLDGSDESPTNCGSYVERCDLETNFCNWDQDADDDFDWQLGKKRTTSPDTGPDDDHTKGDGSGQYAYIDVSEQNRQGDSSRLSSKVFQATTDNDCKIRLFYHMYGNNIGRLNVKIQTTEKGPLEDMWSDSGNKGNMWYRLEVPLKSDVKFKVIVEGVRGSGDQGDVGIDDISFTPGCILDSSNDLPSGPTLSPPCDDTEMSCEDGTCVDSAKLCDFRADCSDGSDENSCPMVCNFDNGMCGWTQPQDDSYDWTKKEGALLPPGTTLPLLDRTTSQPTGQYMYITNRVTAGKAKLNSAVFKRGSKACGITFYYHVYLNSPPVGKLNVYINQMATQVKIWESSNMQINSWTMVDAVLPPCSKDFQISFEADMVSSTKTGHIAIDDVRFENCAIGPAPESCPSDTCQSGHCYSKSETCDAEYDCCEDHTDESSCDQYTRCDFETGFCGWNQMTSDVMDWSRDPHTIGPSPIYDHAFNNDGKYIHVDIGGSVKMDDNAILGSPIIENLGTTNCMMRCFYFVSGSDVGTTGSDVGTIHVSTTTAIGGEPTQRKSVTNPELGKWTKLEVTLDIIGQPFQVLIEAVAKGAEGCIAIDDISFTPDCTVSSRSLPTVVPPTSTQSYIGSSPAASPITRDRLTQNAVPIAVSVVIVTIVTLVLISLIFVFCKRKQKKRSQYLDTGEHIRGIMNSTFTYDAHDQGVFSDFALSNIDPSEDTPGTGADEVKIRDPTSIENPMYGIDPASTEVRPTGNDTEA